MSLLADKHPSRGVIFVYPGNTQTISAVELSQRSDSTEALQPFNRKVLYLQR